MPRLTFILGLLLSFVIGLEVLVSRAFAGGLIFDYEHTLRQYLQLLGIPLATAVFLLGLWRLRTKPHEPYTIKTNQASMTAGVTLYD